MAPLAAPEPMNATTNHSKIRVTVTLPRESVVAGRYVTGKMEVECKSDKLGIGIIMVELFAFQELTSRDHSARMTFLHSRRLFQGPNLPPSNAVYAYTLPGDPPLPEDYYKAKRGHSTFLFRITLPLSSPASINFANGLARVRYEVRGSVGIVWKDLRQLVTDKNEVSVLESFDEDPFGFGPGSRAKAEEGTVVVGENGRFWMHGRVLGGILVAGDSACVELQVKNHSSRKNTGLTLELNRTLLLPSGPSSSSSKPLQISDTILTVPFKGPEYTLPPGGEGVAHLVFDVPPNAKGVRGGTYEGDTDEAEPTSEALFSIQATVAVKVAMGLGRKETVLEIPVMIVHPDALPELPPQPPPIPSEPMLYPQYTSLPQQNHTRPLPQPVIQPYVDSHAQQVWIPPAQYQYYPPDQAYLSPHASRPPPHHETALYPLNQPTYTYLNHPPRQLPPRPSSAGPLTITPAHNQSSGHASPISGLPFTPSDTHPVLLPLPSRHPHPQTPPRTNIPAHPTQISNQLRTSPLHQHIDHPQNQDLTSDDSSQAVVVGQREEGKGAVASRISRHLRQTSVLVGRGRSVSPVAHRFGYPSTSDSHAVNTITAGGTSTGPSGGTGVSADMLVVGVDPVIALPTANVSDGSDPILHSPRPQIRHKQSFTNLNVNGKPVMKSESVWELEKIAAGLDAQAAEVEKDEAKDKGKGKGKEKPSEGVDMNVNVNMNKTLPVPPPSTKPRQHAVDKSNGDAPLTSIFTPPSPLSSPQISSQDPSAPVPPTPTLAACKRPSRLPITLAIPGGGVETGLDALERRLIAQVGTRKVEKEKKPDVRNILAVGQSSSPAHATDAGVTKAKASMRTESSVPSTSTTPNLEGKAVQSGNESASASSERMLLPDESAISSLTLDQSSVGDADAADGHKEDVQERLLDREGSGDEQEQEQESVDGGKTHRAGKSVVGVESYFQSRNHQPQQQQQHRRERAGAESRILSHIAVTTSAKPATASAQVTGTSSTESPKNSGGAASNKSKKSARTRGRVTAWLGGIDPDAPPPQEEIIPPSPSVVRSVEWDSINVDEEEEKPLRGLQSQPRFNPQIHSRSPSPPPAPAQSLPSTPLRNSIHPEIVQAETTTPSPAAAGSPNPRSSGFMPIETMKAQRDTVTKSMTRSMLRRAGGIGKEATVVKEARRVMDIWAEESTRDSPSVKPARSEALGSSPTPATRMNGKQEEEKKAKKEQHYPFVKPSPPKTQTVRTDRRVSPPSNTPGGGVRNVSKSIPKVVEPKPAAVPPPSIRAADSDKPVTTRLTPSPVSYANVASRASPKPSGAHAAQDGPPKKNGRLPLFPPPPQQEDGKYDVRSARGGRGGKVTHVASLWASVAAGNAGAGNNAVKPTVGVMKDVKGVVIGGSPANAKDVPIRGRPVPPSTTVADAKKSSGPPMLLPRKSSATFVTPSSAGGHTAEKNRPQSKTPTPSSKPVPPKPTSKPKTPPPLATKPAPKPKPAPPVIAQSPLPSNEPRPNRPLEKAKGAPIPVSMAKSTSVPALVSSSFATPTLSSTASLVRPVGRGGSRTSTVAVGLPGIGRGDYKSAVTGNGRGAGGGGLNGAVKHSGAARKKSGLGVVGEEGISRGGNDDGAQGPLKPSNHGPDLVSTPTAMINNAKPNVVVSSNTSGGNDIKTPPSRDTAFGQARLRDLIKKYQGSNA